MVTLFALWNLTGCVDVGINDVSTGPAITMITPVDGGTFDPAQPVQVCVSVEYDLPPETLEAVVATDTDGTVASDGFGDCEGGDWGIEVMLSDAPHVLTMTVTDSRGRSDSATATIAPAPPCEPVDELPNGADDDCDGIVDEGTELYDDDGDGFAEVDGDCDDTTDAIGPDATDIPDDGIDQDCSGTDTVTCYEDGDEDDYGVDPVLADDGDCFDPGEAPVDGDCEDGDASINPGAPEIPGDGIDQDCSGDDPAGCFEDGDGDGFGTDTVLPPGDGDCDDPGESPFSTDCNDNDAGINPDASEVFDDGIDQDCSGADSALCFVDGDSDSYGGPMSMVEEGQCVIGVDNDDDCNDMDAAINPAAVDIPANGIDEDCDGVDAENGVMEEVLNGIDDNGDGRCDEGLIGYGALIVTEFMANPEGGGSPENGEWFEVYNTTSTEIRLCEDWEFSDEGADSFFVQDETVVVPAGGYAVLARDPSTGNGPSSPPPATFLWTGNWTLSNSSDEIIIAFDGVLIDTITNVGSSSSGDSRELKLANYSADENDSNLNWCDSTVQYGSDGNGGTPGAAPSCN